MLDSLLSLSKRALTFLRVVDPHDGLLSLTNIALMIVIVKIALVKQPTAVDLGGLFVAIANYNAKKFLNQGAGDPPPATEEKS